MTTCVHSRNKFNILRDLGQFVNVCTHIIIYIPHTVSADTTNAVKHLLTVIGYEAKPGDQGPFAMEMEPEDIQWLRVRESVLVCNPWECCYQHE